LPFVNKGHGNQLAVRQLKVLHQSFPPSEDALHHAHTQDAQVSYDFAAVLHQFCLLSGTLVFLVEVRVHQGRSQQAQTVLTAFYRLQADLHASSLASQIRYFVPHDVHHSALN